MNISFKMNLDGVLVKSPEKFHQDLWHEVGLAMNLSVNEMVSGIKSHTPIGATGKLKQGIHGDIQRATGRMIGNVTPTMPYALAVEKGTRKHWVPIESLKYWVVRKLQLPENIAYAIQKKIAKVGTSKAALRKTGSWGYKMFERGFADKENKVIKIFQSFIHRFLRKHGGS